MIEIIEKIKYNTKLIKGLEISSWLIFMTFLITACSTIKYIPIENSSITKVEIKDSLLIRDSVVITPVYTVKEISNIKDTLVMENENSISKTYVDSSLMILKGSLKSKGNTKYRTLVKERVIEKCDTIQITKEVPVEVIKKVRVIPKSYYFLLLSFVITVAVIILRIILKFYIRWK